MGGNAARHTRPHRYQRAELNDLFRAHLPGSWAPAFSRSAAATASWLVYFHLKFGCAVTGCVSSVEGCRLARKSLATAGIAEAVIETALFALDGQYDVVFSARLVEHFDDPEPVFGKLASLVALWSTVLRPLTGGIGCVCLIPSVRSPVRERTLLSVSVRDRTARLGGVVVRWRGDHMMEVPFPRAALEQSICDRFAQQVARYGARLAVKTQRAELTYEALNRNANRVAHAILGRRRPPEEPVALFFEPGAGEIAALLGVLKAGHPFLPLAPSSPPGALARLLEDSTAALILTSTEACARLRESAPEGSEVLVLDALDASLSTEDPVLPRSAAALACIMYTSGSTGKPKGVVHTDRTVLHRVMTFVNSAGIEPDDRIALLTSCSFSAALRLVFGALLTGAALFPFDVAAAAPDALAAWVAREEITIYASVPSVFRRFAGALSGPGALPTLRRLRTSGETLSAADVQLYRERFPGRCVLVNALSSNEAGTIVEYAVDHAQPLTGKAVPAGYASEDKEVLVVDETRAGVSPGEVGEIAVRSRYLSPGYWRRPDLTAAAFLPDPHGGDARVYLTGDLGRLGADGCLEHLGRKDFRVKIRGQQVEVSEIETALMDLGVKDAVVVGRDDGTGGQRLVAYVVVSGRPALTVSMLRRGLSERLPSHMIPAAFVVLDSLPLTSNGKVDRQSLPSPEPVRPELETPFEAPRTPVEEAVAAIWTEALRLDRVGIHDNFLDLGGHSLLATQVISRVTQRFAVDVPVRTLFDAPTVAAMAMVVVQHLATRAGDEAMSRLWADLERAREPGDLT